MFITVTFQIRDQKYDLYLDNEQTVAHGLEALKNIGRYPDETIDFYRSHCSERLVSAYETFAEQSIENGDLLQAVLPEKE